MLTAPAGVTLVTVAEAAIGDVEVAGGVEGQAVGVVDSNPEAKVLTTPAGVTLLTVLPV